MEWLMEVDPTILAALFAAVSAIFAPMITTWLNNRHHYKMRKLEMVQAERIKAIQDYAKSCSNYIAHCHRAELADYSKSYGKIFLYTDKKYWKKIREIHEFIESGNLQAASEKFADLCQSLSGEMTI